MTKKTKAFRARFARAKKGESGSNFGQSPKFEPPFLLFCERSEQKRCKSLFCHVLKNEL